MSGTEPNPNAAARPRRRWRPLLLFIGLLATGGGIFWLAGGFYGEPTYQGKPASFWLDMESSEREPTLIYSPQARFYSEELIEQTRDTAFKAMGNQGVSFLITTIRHKPSRMLVNVVAFLNQHNVPMGDWIEEHVPNPDRIEDRRYRAVTIISDFSAEGVRAAPTLVRVFGDQRESQELRTAAGRAVVNNGEAGLAILPHLIGVLRSTNEDDDFHATVAEMVGMMGPKAAAAIPVLKVAAYTPQQDMLNLSAAKALWRVDRDTNVFVEVCSNLLHRVDVDSRWSAVVALRELGAAARQFSSEIQSAITNREEYMRWEAARTLRQVDSDAFRLIANQINRDLPSQVSRITTALNSTNWNYLPDALHAVSVLGPQARGSVPALIDLLAASRVEDFAASNRVARSLASKRALSTARRLASITASELAPALVEIGPGARDTVPQLIALLHSPEHFHRASLCRVLGAVGSDAREALPVLESFLQSDAPDVQMAAAEAVTRIAPDQCSNAVLVLRRAIEKDRLPTSDSVPLEEQHRALIALWRLKREPRPPVEAMLKEWKVINATPNYVRRMGLIYLLGEIGPEAKAALPLLEDCLDEELELARAAAIAIRKIDPGEYTRLGLPGVLAIP